MNEFLTLEYLGTFVGLTFAVGLIVQFSKSIIKTKFGDGLVRLYTFVVALILSFVFANNGFGAQGIILTIINSILISTSAMGGYELIADPKALKSK